MKQILLVLLALMMAIAVASAQTSAPTATQWLTFLPTETRTLLLKQGQIVNTASKIQNLKWLTAAPWAATVAPAWRGRDTNIAAEMITLIDLPAPKESLKARSLRTFNTLNAVSTMKGTQYWSVTQKRWETLILESYRVESPQKQQKLPDPTFTTVPKSSAMTVFQKDNRFGDGYSRLIYTAQPNGFLVTMRNLTGLNYGVLPLVDPGNFQMTFAIAFLKDKAAIYTVMGAKTASLGGLEASKSESFKHRMQALTRWFANSL